ncbi:MAG TPA: alpha/beta hydrolase domain-containing protein [Acidimicrobiales bacterium]|nr:alpha/beta hydrolase domain-containing protein [Acidimicrobiales bacterium]
MNRFWGSSGARSLLIIAVLAAALSFVSAPQAMSATPVASPKLTDPPAGLRGYPLWDSYYDLTPFGYEEHEYFVSGTAKALDGSSKPYTTRMIVTRPTDPAKFNGTVFLDWVNVTAQFENAVDTMLTRQMLMREGFAYVHVSAQSAGLCCTPLTPKVWDPVRYAAISHPGDAYAFDMFTQIAQSFKAPAGIDPMGDLGASRVQRVLAGGQSQSANELQDYITQWLPAHPEATGVLDGILVHGNVPGDKSFGAKAPVPVLHLLSDYEAQDDHVDPNKVGPNYRLWEIAGASHSDMFIGYQSVAGHGPRVLAGAAKTNAAGYRAIIDTAGDYGEVVHPMMATCTLAGATLPIHYADSAALHSLNQWVATGAAPPNGPRFEFAGGKLATDEYGNTLGGIRMPPIDVPVAHYVSTICQLGGITVPFSDQQIQQLYGTHANYYALMQTRTDSAVRAGWMLPDDAVDLMRRACAAKVRFGETASPCAPYVPPA